MTRYQSDVLWLGLILIALNVIIHIKELKSVLFSGPSASSNAPSGGNPPAPSGPGPGPSIPGIPGLPLVPIPGLPTITLPGGITLSQPGQNPPTPTPGTVVV